VNQLGKKDLKQALYSKEFVLASDVEMDEIAKSMSSDFVAHDIIETGLRIKILEALYRLNANSGVNIEILQSKLREMGEHGKDATAILTAVWNAQKQGWIKFNEKHTAHGSELTRIRLTPEGRAHIVKVRGTTDQAAERTPGFREKGFSGNNRHGASHAVGRDGTQFQTHRKRAEGGEITVEVHKPAIPAGRKIAYCLTDGIQWPCPTARERGITAGLEPAVFGSDIAAPPPPIGDPPRQNEKPAVSFTGERSDTRAEKGSLPHPPASSPHVSSTDTHGEYAKYPQGVSDGGSIQVAERIAESLREFVKTKYPPIWALMERRQEKAAARKKAEALIAAAALVDEFDSDEARRLTDLASRAEGEPFNQLEASVLTFLDELEKAGREVSR
jgi:hypothetical protein